MKLIQQHLKNIESTLASYYDLTSISGHSGNLGVSRELVIKHFLSNNLSSNLDFTSGEIFDSSDNLSGQLDIIIHQASTMKLNIAHEIDLVPVDCVKAIIECKSNLQTGSMKKPGRSSLKSALDSCVRVKKLNRINPVGIDKQYLKNNKMPENMPKLLFDKTGLTSTLNDTPYLILAFKGPTENKLRECLYKYMNENSVSLEKMPNMITVLGSKGYSLVQNDGFYMRKVEKSRNVHWSRLTDGGSSLVGMYMYLMKLSEAGELSQNLFPMKEYISEC